jgi:quercetin dioxygenase-like cupin family protein
MPSLNENSVPMEIQRIFHSSDFLRPSDGEPLRSVITESAEAVVVAWIVKPAQRIAAHVHPHGQDTWTVLSGQGDYQLEAEGDVRLIRTGDVAIAPTGCVHGVHNNGHEDLIFISVVSPAEAGFERL